MPSLMLRGHGVAAARVAAARVVALALGGCSLIQDPDADAPSTGDPTSDASGPATAITTKPTGLPTAFDQDATTEFPEEDVLDAATGDDVVLTLTADEVTARSLPGLATAYKLTVGDGKFTDLWTEAGVGYTLEVAGEVGSGTEVGDDHFTVSRFDLETGEVSYVATAVVPQNPDGPSRPATGRITGIWDDTAVVDSYVSGVDNAHTVLAIGLTSGRLLWQARPAQVLTVTGTDVIINTGRGDIPGSIKALEMDSGDVRWSALPDTLGASAIGATDKWVVIARADNVFPDPSITSLSLHTGNAHPAQTTDSWDWHCAAASQPVAVCTLADVERVVGWNLELNLEEWSLPTKDRFAPIVTLVQDDLVYGLLDNGTGLVLDAFTGDDVATTRARDRPPSTTGAGSCSTPGSRYSCRTTTTPPTTPPTIRPSHPPSHPPRTAPPVRPVETPFRLEAMSSHIVSATAVVPAPADVIFSILADPRQHPRIDGSGTVRGVLSGPDRLSLDATFGMNMKQGAPYKITSRVTEFEEDARLAWRHPLGHVWRYVLEPVDGGTRVTESFDFSDLGSVHAALLSLGGFPRRNQKGIEQTLVRLAEVAKADSAGSSA